MSDQGAGEELLTGDDLRQLATLGIERATAERQLAQLRQGAAWQCLERPCIPGDGIAALPVDRGADLERQFAAATAAGRISRFIPASGAATRMFQPLLVDAAVLDAWRAVGPDAATDESLGDLQRFAEEFERFPFAAELQRLLAADGLSVAQLLAERDLAPLLDALLAPTGLGYADLPKGLLPFHRAADGLRSPFIEHQAEAALLDNGQGRVALHLTVSPEHLDLFRAEATAWRQRLCEGYGCQPALSYSTQQPCTDTLALNAAGRPARDVAGRLLLRPGGHGALLANLAGCGGDIVLLRNIDNVVPDANKATNLRCGRLLAGYLLELQQEQHGLLRELHQHGDDPLLRDLAFGFLYDRLQLQVPLDLDLAGLIAQLDRPLRVCGMVANLGEPGGGPFWVRDATGLARRQIVETAQIDGSDPQQAALLAASTHFNPVDMACALRDWQGRPYDLVRFVDADAVIVAAKVQQGETLRVLELPGLWNGGMAGWLTLFVEIPGDAFNPVKTLFDLLRPAHQVDA
ncbi:MAG: DUF4301 family protein [Desulfuromonadales bacterium]|nr:DUF4301 family protein [Desulfuromonadales bacterium]